MDEETRRAFDDAARARDPGLLVEVIAFLRENRSWWLVPILAVLLKRTYRLEAYGPAVRAEADRPLLGGDKPFADPMNTTVQYEADFVPFKSATDVVLVGTAHAPGGRAVREFTASLEAP